MAKTRASKLKRKQAKPIRLTARDIEIIRALHRHRFLTTDHLQKLTRTESRWAINARLRLLYDHKYIDRPQAQKSLYSHSDKRPVIYALGNKGASLLSTRFGIPMPSKVYWTEKNRRVREAHIEHTLGIADFVIGIEIMCQEAEHIEFIDPQTIIANSPKQTQRAKYPFRWKTNVRHEGERHSIHIVPDYVFGLRNSETNKERYYFVEIDRGTMPVSRRDIKQTSYMRKIYSYISTLENELAKKRFGIDGFQILTIATSEARIESIQQEIAWIKAKPFSSNTFLFKIKGDFQNYCYFYQDWQNSKGENSTLLSSKSTSKIIMPDIQKNGVKKNNSNES